MDRRVQIRGELDNVDCTAQVASQSRFSWMGRRSAYNSSHRIDVWGLSRVHRRGRGQRVVRRRELVHPRLISSTRRRTEHLNYVL
jgi:hypothetical protein